MTYDEIIDWLNAGDVSIQYQTHKDLLRTDKKAIQNLKSKISLEGFGKRFLDKQNQNGHWGSDFYQPKWISTHYTLLDLRNLEIEPTPSILNIIDVILDDYKSKDGGINPGKTISQSDVCINGMVLNYACYFNATESKLQSIVDFILTQQMDDGGFNCRKNRSGAHHSSLHSTICVLEGMSEYIMRGYTYRADELNVIILEAIEFMLAHRLYKSDKTGKIIHKSFTMLSYPSRWRYDVLRSLDYLRYANFPFDSRMREALELLIKKRNNDGTWNVQAKHAGQVHFDMERTGKPSRWNTLRALRVLKYYDALKVKDEYI